MNRKKQSPDGCRRRAGWINEQNTSAAKNTSHFRRAQGLLHVSHFIEIALVEIRARRLQHVEIRRAA